MLRRPGLRSVAGLLATALASVVLAVVPLGGAGAAGEGNPVITSPTATKPFYEGFTGPYAVDFGNAPIGGYRYWVERTSLDQEPVLVGEGTFAWTGNGPESRSFSLPALPPYGAYRFAIQDTDTGNRRAGVTFEVRAGKQPRCSVITPANLRVKAAETVVLGTRASNCSSARIQYASWDVKNLSRGTYVNSLAFNGNTKDTWTYFDGQPLGIYVVKPVTAYNAAGDDIIQNTPRTVVRIDSRFSFSATRSGQYVTLKTSIRKYSRSANTFGPWGKKAFALSYRNCSTCAWKHFHTQKTSTGGKASYRLRAPSTREYRVTASGTSSVWAPYPHYVKR